MDHTTVSRATGGSSRPVATPARLDAAGVVALAEVVDRDGLDAHAAELSALAESARLSGVSPVLLDVMLGAGEPYVARVRAFARVGAAVADPRRTQVAPVAGSAAPAAAAPAAVPAPLVAA